MEDGDIASARSAPPTALDAFADLFSRLAPLRRVDYSLANRLSRYVAGAGFTHLGLHVHQPADRAGASGLLLKWSVQEAAPAFVDAGLIQADEIDDLISSMQSAADKSRRTRNGAAHVARVGAKALLIERRSDLRPGWVFRFPPSSDPERLCSGRRSAAMR